MRKIAFGFQAKQNHSHEGHSTQAGTCSMDALVEHLRVFSCIEALV